MGVIDLAVVTVIASTILLLVWKLERNFTARVGNIELTVDQVNKQVNHVDDPTEPTLRELVSAIHEQLTDTRTHVAENTRSLARVERRVASVEVAQLAQADRLSEVGRLARAVADRNRKIDESPGSPERGMSNVEVLIIILVILLILIVVGVLPR